MKRIILSLLCLLMVFSLTACGNKENEEKLEKYGYLINCVENGNYDSAEYELQRIITETKKAPYVSDEYEEIEITIDNWKDYLEIKKNVNIFTDAFDEIESVSLLNCLYLTSDSSISNSLKIDGNDVKIIVKDYETIHVVRIQGTIKVYK